MGSLAGGANGCRASLWQMHVDWAVGFVAQQDRPLMAAGRRLQQECDAPAALWQQPQHFPATGFARDAVRQLALAGAALAANNPGINSHASHRVAGEEPCMLAPVRLVAQATADSHALVTKVNSFALFRPRRMFPHFRRLHAQRTSG